MSAISARVPLAFCFERSMGYKELRKLEKLHTTAGQLCKISIFRKVDRINIRIYAYSNEYMQ
ncbi:MAG: hypothetical protein QM296_07895 [Bacillota bacterium]|nr:hypothetical protein [Bacillota bacterium]